MLIPLSWQGFTTVDDKGYVKKTPSIDINSQNEEYWGYHQALYASDYLY